MMRSGRRGWSFTSCRCWNPCLGCCAGWVTKKIRETVSARGQAHFLPVLDHEADWKRVAGFNAADDAYVLVVDGNGTVRWRTQGRLSDRTYAEMKRQVAKVSP